MRFRTLPCIAILAFGGLVPESVGAQPASARLDRLVAELLPVVEELSGLPPLAPLHVAARSRTELRSVMAEAALRDNDPDEIRNAETAYRLLGLLPDSIDLRTLVPELLSEQIAGYYDFRADTLFILDDVPDEELRAVVAHEITHALQDQHFRLDSLLARDVGNDALMATRAAFEGHATLVMIFIRMEELLGEPLAFDDLPDLTRLPLEALMPGTPSPAFARAPRILRENGAFPYGRGVGLAHALRTRHPGAVPFLDHLPASTEQVVDPYVRFLDERDEPTIVALDSTAADPWHVTYRNSLGQFELSILLMERHRLQSEGLAAGWDGDAYRLLTDGTHHALEWFIVWDDARAASRFVTAYIEILRTRMGRSATVEAIELDGRPGVRIVEADQGVDVATVPRSTVRLSGGLD